MIKKFDPENPVLNPSSIDSEMDIKTKIFIDLKDHLIPLSGIKIIKKEDKVLYQTILDMLNISRILKNINEYTSISSTLNNNLLNELSTDFPKLNIDELTTINSYIVNQNIPGFNVNSDKIKDLLKSNEASKPLLIKKFLQTKILEEMVVKYIGSFDNYTTVLASINLQISKNPIDIYKLIQNYKLSPYIPFMMATKETTNEPIIKFYEGTDKENLKDWVYTKTNVIKHPKGLIVKVLFKDSTYKTLNISKNTNIIHLKIGFSESEIKHKDILQKTEDVRKFLSEIKRYIPAEDQIPIKKNILNFNISLSFKEIINVKKIMVWLRNNHQNYMSENFKDRVKFKNYKDAYSFNLKTRDKKTTLIISQLSQKQEIYKALWEFFEILVQVIDAKIIIEERSQQPKGQKKSRKLKDLKALGIFIKSADCQKIRHVDIYEEGKKIPEGSYVLDYKDVQFYCKTDDYPYPGFTNSNAPCCFKKDQREKEVYKRNLGQSQLRIVMSDRQLLKTNLITTNKILEANRIGIMPNFTDQLFGEDYLRVGVYKNTFLNAVKFLAEKQNILSSEALDKNLYKTLLLPNNKILSEDISYQDYKDIIKSENTKDNRLQNLFEKILNTGIIVVKVDTVIEDLSLEIPDIYWDISDYPYYFFVLNIVSSGKSQTYEPIVLKQKDKLKKKFSKNDDLPMLINQITKKLNIRKLSPLSYEPPNIKYLKDINITSQLVNNFNKVEYIETPDGILPVKLTAPRYGIKIVEQFTNLFSFAKQLNFLKEMSKKHDAYIPVALFKDNKKVNAIVTKSGIIVPVVESKIPVNTELQIINNKLPLYMSNILHKNTTVDDPVSNYNESLSYKTELYEHFRFLLSSVLKDETLSKKVKSIIDENINFNDRFSKLQLNIDQILRPYIKITKRTLLVKTLPSIRELCHVIDNCETNKFCKKTHNGCYLYVNDTMYPDILNKLTIEMFNSTDILKGKIQVEFLDKNNFVKRSGEKILLNKEDIRKLI